MQLKYSNYVAFSHDHGFAVNNSGLKRLFAKFPTKWVIQITVIILKADSKQSQSDMLS